MTTFPTRLIDKVSFWTDRAWLWRPVAARNGAQHTAAMLKANAGRASYMGRRVQRKRQTYCADMVLPVLSINRVTRCSIAGSRVIVCLINSNGTAWDVLCFLRWRRAC